MTTPDHDRRFISVSRRTHEQLSAVRTRTGKSLRAMVEDAVNRDAAFRAYTTPGQAE